MSHAVSTFVGPGESIRKLSQRLASAPVYRVRSDRYLFLPVTDDVADLATSLKGTSDVFASGFSLFTAALADLAKEASSAAPVAYVWTDYFGGKGNQGAIAWEKGQLLSPPGLGSGSINAALQHLGVKAESSMDEFDTVGLGSVRSNDRFEGFPQVG